MRKILIFFLFFDLQHCVYSQGIDNLWMMGYMGRMSINFSTGAPIITTVSRPMTFDATNANISDVNGNLLFYTNGIYIANVNGDTMPNGSGLNPSSFTSSNYPYGNSLEQACIILPFPGDSSKYYLFHMTIDDGPVIYSNHLYYTLIDMTLDTGLGGVVTKNNAILNTVLLPIGLTGCKHANGRDWWLVCHEQGSNRYYKFLITPYGILGPYSQNIGKIATGSYNGQTVFSPDGKKFANYDVGDDLDIMDFDRCTGDFSNCIHDSINDSAICGGVAFSEDSKILYVSSMSYIYQYDMTSSNVLATQTIVAINDTFASPSPPFYTTFFLSQLAPDGKIYVNCGNGTLDMHVVNYPDSLGIVCAVCQHCIHLPSFNAFTIPNFPNYFLGADTTSSICDTVHLGIQNAELKMQDELNLFPNPVSRVLYSTLHQNLKLKSVKVLNVFGQEMPLNFSFIKNGEYLEINTASLSRGVYFLELLSEKEKAVKRFVKE